VTAITGETGHFPSRKNKVAGPKAR